MFSYEVRVFEYGHPVSQYKDLGAVKKPIRKAPVKTYINVWDEVIAQIKAAFTPENGKCPIYIEAHPGRFDDAEVRRLARHTSGNPYFAYGDR